jgi:hypothetical protein
MGPDFGRCEVVIDARKLAELDLYAARAEPAHEVFACENAGDGYHAVVLHSLSGRLVVDSLDVLH